MKSEVGTLERLRSDRKRPRLGGSGGRNNGRRHSEWFTLVGEPEGGEQSSGWNMMPLRVLRPGLRQEHSLVIK